MFTRRDLFLSGALASGLRPAAAQRGSAAIDPTVENVLREIRDALKALRQVTVPQEITDIREKQRIHLKINQKLPDFIDVGVRVWEHLYDWHLDNHLPLTISRANGVAQMEVMLTTLVLRPEIPETQIGVPYDR